MLIDIAEGIIYRIKDNNVKEVTPALRGKWVRHKENKYERELPIEYLDYAKQKIGINDVLFDLARFNKLYELVED